MDQTSNRVQFRFCFFYLIFYFVKIGPKRVYEKCWGTYQLQDCQGTFLRTVRIYRTDENLVSTTCPQTEKCTAPTTDHFRAPPVNQRISSPQSYSPMSTDRLVKMTFRGVSRNILLPTPATIVDLQTAVASTFGNGSPMRSTTTSPHGLCFTFKDVEGDDIVFDTDKELNLALKVCPKELEISATTASEVRYFVRTMSRHTACIRMYLSDVHHGMPRVCMFQPD